MCWVTLRSTQPTGDCDRTETIFKPESFGTVNRHTNLHVNEMMLHLSVNILYLSETFLLLIIQFL